MNPLRQPDVEPVVLRLARDLTRTIKRGHPWVYAEALRDLPPAAAGTSAVLLDQRRGTAIARGYYDPASPIPLRICEPNDELLTQRWALQRFRLAQSTRASLIDPQTTGYRLLNGEGDGVPGLVVDRYDRVAVVKLDGPAPSGFWSPEGVAEWLIAEAGIETVVLRPRQRGQAGEVIHGQLDSPVVPFLEYGIQFTADVLQGQKTGFFLDQRENRQTIRRLAMGRRVLNVFSYTGGFSVAAGVGGASAVVSVDLADPAIAAAREHWVLNGLPEEAHRGVTEDAFAFFEAAHAARERWDLVILDPPSFAPSSASVPAAKAAYQRLFAEGARATARQGWLALSSCSSHIDEPLFLEIIEEALSEARRRGQVVRIDGQPADHPWPLALPEYRYLKFALLRLD